MRALSEVLEAQRTPRHAVQFYEDEDFLVGSVARFIGSALRAGEGAIVVATRAHLDALSRALEGFDLARAIESGRAQLHEARATLALFMVDGKPDRDRMRAVIVPALEECAKAIGPCGVQGRIHVFGEMVDLLVKDGEVEAARSLEALWTELFRGYGLDVLCGYALDNFANESGAEHFEQVCALHDCVIPAEGYTRLDDLEARHREVASLQQRARALDIEIQKREELEHALRQAMREARRAEHTSRMRDQLLAGIAHELRIPLKAISGWASLLQSEQGVDAREAGQTIEASTRVQASLLDEVTDASRLLGGTLRIRPGPVDLGFVLREAADAIGPAAVAKGVHLSIQIDSDPCLAHADLHRIRQVFSSLLSNAVQLTPAGGGVEARLSRTEDQVDFVVRDNGIGIPQGALASVFDRLQRLEEATNRQGAGLRLGLAVARHLVELHGGTIEAQSDGPDEGSTFTVTLPRRAVLRDVG